MLTRQDGLQVGVFTPDDLELMRNAFHLALSSEKGLDGSDKGEDLGRSIIRLYRMGLHEPQKLGAVAALMTSTRLVRSTGRLHIS
ncbi:hypothetical protein [Pseudorhizobium flavum]|uniref:Uncharacterized protein n=1 Tax=Pseudorhizobium flavum TaxID=1335061 RepID=A0A7W9Z1F7_9HYPH|nr:hypothetical protein [Pseudorhizobium flavum]MBB6180896.1 hypothetical protein [Pseudorhizobium flavum]CAD6602172.1 hypothetical protein RFYW14_01058 [Pseudorhizobium flavum]